MQVILTGGPSDLERATGMAIEAIAKQTLRNQIGKDTLPQLLGLMARSRLLLTPDSGPAHMATMVGLPVLGLYAATNPARSGPYLSRALCIDQYGAAARRFLGKDAADLPWTTKIERPGVMELITRDEVVARLDEEMAHGQANPVVLPA
jgi:heptosyltransferase I